MDSIGTRWYCKIGIMEVASVSYRISGWDPYCQCFLPISGGVISLQFDVDPRIVHSPRVNPVQVCDSLQLLSLLDLHQISRNPHAEAVGLRLDFWRIFIPHVSYKARCSLQMTDIFVDLQRCSAQWAAMLLVWRAGHLVHLRCHVAVFGHWRGTTSGRAVV